MFEQLVNYQIGIFGISLKKLTADGCSRSIPLAISLILTNFYCKKARILAL
jgi:hypothetical protein